MEDILTTALIESALKNKTEVLLLPSVDSTNNEAKRLIKSGRNTELLIVSEEQTAGRGRQGKSFYSPKNTGIYMSLILFFESGSEELLKITTEAAVAVSRAIETLSSKAAKIKWVNDIYIGGKKVCGILCESVKSVDGKTAVIIGIGVNINTAEFPESVENGGSIGSEISRASLVCEITNELYRAVFSGGEVIPYYRSRSVLTGKRIYFIKDGVKTPATAVDIDDRGGLVVLLENGEKQTLVSGEISVRAE